MSVKYVIRSLSTFRQTIGDKNQYWTTTKGLLPQGSLHSIVQFQIKENTIHSLVPKEEQHTLESVRKYLRWGTSRRHRSVECAVHF